MKVSRAGIILIKSFEGFRPVAVRREDGQWTIGYGHTASAREGLSVSEPDAELLLQYDLIPVVAAVGDNAPSDLNQHQFDALASFAFSVGVERFLKSDVLARLKAGETARAGDALIGWPQPQPADAHVRRRRAERALFVADPSAPVALADLLSAPAPMEFAPASAMAPVPAPVEQADEPNVAPVPLPEPARSADAPSMAHQMLRYSPYATPMAGTLPPVIRAPEIEAASAPVVTPAFPPMTVAPSAVEGAPIPAWRAPAEGPGFTEVSPVIDDGPAPHAPSFTPGAPSPFPPLANELAPPPLVLTAPPSIEPEVIQRPVWERRQTDRPDQDGLFLHEGITASDFAPVLRHEADATPPSGRFDWSETGAFLVMGGVGLASFGAAMAAFRLAGDQAVGGRETTMIGWVLAVIAAVCVGVSGYNLYRRWGQNARG
ncbi:MAG: hypothetical protein EON91_08520 [Brevundimonas sp.]|uniref:glycoside hydrolase family protein n=1 Tax=Brevundimonas sp. TaxID=1871086 RepID=UPI0011FA0BFC|nr:glycoside hydrolase family protein [Brevundimonas sp.]RZJ17634.1 MAG: hypothetical protein EON91_08520 [Brevundimonas sp.]